MAHETTDFGMRKEIIQKKGKLTTFKMKIIVRASRQREVFISQLPSSMWKQKAINQSQSHPQSRASEGTADGVGEDRTERGSSKCFILMFLPCSSLCLFCTASFLPGLLRKQALTEGCAASCGGL